MKRLAERRDRGEKKEDNHNVQQRLHIPTILENTETEEEEDPTSDESPTIPIKISGPLRSARFSFSYREMIGANYTRDKDSVFMATMDDR